MAGSTFKTLALIASLVCNAVFIFGLAYIKGPALWDKAVALLSRSKGADLEAMNRTGLAIQYNSEIVFAAGAPVLRVVVLGNSLAYHPQAPSIGWTTEAGMAASSPESDYVHLLMLKLSKRYGANVNFTVSNLADFERNFDDFDSGSLAYLAHPRPDLVVFQLGDNVGLTQANYSAFVNKFEAVTSAFDDSPKIVTTPFFSSSLKNDAALEVAMRTGSSIVDLSHLAVLDRSSVASSERNYQHAGVGAHPGDRGMKKIADLLFLAAARVIEANSSHLAKSL